jgi:outer membrane protein assembly factor BamB
LAWAGRYPSPGGSEREGGRAIATTPDGSVVVVASTHRDLAYEAATGRLLWSEPNGAPGVVGGQDVAVSPSGTLAVSVGEAAYPHPERVISGEVVLTARQPRTGRRLWQSRYRDPGGGPYTPRAVVVSDAAVFVAGEGLLPRRVFAAAFDPHTGAPRWVSHEGTPAGPAGGPTRAVSAVATPDGRRLFVSGFDVVDPPWVGWVTVAYDGATGALLWRARFPGTGSSAAEPKEVVLHPDGHLLYVTGWSREPGVSGESFDFATVAYDTTTGKPVWTGGYRSAFAGFPVDSDDLGWSVDLSPDGRRLFVAGYSEDPDLDPLGYGYRVEARDALTGEQLWSAAVPWLSATSDQEGLFGNVMVRASPDGRSVYLAMSAHDNLSPDRYDVPGGTYRDIGFAVAALDAASGRFLWRGTYAAPDIPATYMHDFAVDPDGRRLYVTGTALGSGRSVTETAAFMAGPD